MNLKNALKLECSQYQNKVLSPLKSSIVKPASNNKKLSGTQKLKVITKGRYAGLPMFKVSLEERKTCPKSCELWKDCYGNNMIWGHRIDHEHPEFYTILESELDLISKRSPLGFVVRLHELGDFFSTEYTSIWASYISKFPRLNIIGFTSRSEHSEIGGIIAEMNKNRKRVYIRWSNTNKEMGTTIGPKEKKNFRCPAETIEDSCCMNCTACWETDKLVKFTKH